MAQATAGFHPHREDRRILDDLARSGISTSDAQRRGLHLVAHERWIDEVRADAEKMRAEKVNDEPDAW